MGLRLDWGGASKGNGHLVPTYIPIPGLTLPVAGGGGGSNTAHALLGPDPETLCGEGVPPSHKQVPGNQGAPRPNDSRSPRSPNGRSQPLSEPEIRPRHYSLGVGT